MAEEGAFEVVVTGPIKSSAEGYRRAQEVPASELPQLAPSEKDFAQRFGGSEETWRRSRLANRYGLEWMRQRGIEFGRIAQKLLESIGPGYQARALRVEGFKERWVLRVDTPDGTANVAVPANVAEDILDSYTIQDLDRLKSILSANLQRKDLIGLQ